MALFIWENFKLCVLVELPSQVGGMLFSPGAAGRVSLIWSNEDQFSSELIMLGGVTMALVLK